MKKLLAIALLVVLLSSSFVTITNDTKAATIYENMPVVPPEEVQKVCPYSVMSAHSLQFNNYSGELMSIADWYMAMPGPGTSNFTGIRFAAPYPNSSTSTISVLEDKLWINELVSINLFSLIGAPFPDIAIAPIVVLNTTSMSHDPAVLWGYLMMGLNEWMTNMSIVDRSWFPPWLLDFRIYGSAYIDLKLLGSPKDITVMGFYITNCSRETYWQETTQFYYSYYTSQKKYDATLQIHNNISTSDYYDVRWYVGYPQNRTVDPATLQVYDLDNDIYLIAGQHYDSSNAGVWMSFPFIGMNTTRSFRFSIYGLNATIGLGMAIAYADSYINASLGSVLYMKSTPVWTNNYGRVYQGAVFIQLSLPGGIQRYIDPSTVKVYDLVNGVYLQDWQFAVSAGMIVVDYAVVPVGSVQGYDVYYKVDVPATNAWSFLTPLVAGLLFTSPLFLAFILCIGATIAFAVNRKNDKLFVVVVLAWCLFIGMVVITYGIGNAP